ncbi:MAG: Uma2 family endonuclease [Cyanobacteria bacterium P01_A01_bin.37]
MNTALNLSLEEFLNLPEQRWQELPDYPYEFQEGEFIELQENLEHSEIADIIRQVLITAGEDTREIKTSSCQLEVSGGTRRPDLMLLANRRKGRSIIRFAEPTPRLVVEVVSPKSAKIDYEEKRTEYEARGIPEYWIVDPKAQSITINILVGSTYRETKLTHPDDAIVSQAVPEVSMQLGELFE